MLKTKLSKIENVFEIETDRTKKYKRYYSRIFGQDIRILYEEDIFFNFK